MGEVVRRFNRPEPRQRRRLVVIKLSKKLPLVGVDPAETPDYLLEFWDEKTGPVEVTVTGHEEVAVVIRHLAASYEKVEVHNHTNEAQERFGIGANVAPFASAS